MTWNTASEIPRWSKAVVLFFFQDTQLKGLVFSWCYASYFNSHPCGCSQEKHRKKMHFDKILVIDIGKSLSEVLIFASTNPQYDNRLFIVQENCKLRIPAEHVVYTNCCFCFVLTLRIILVHNMFCRCCELLKKICLYILSFDSKNQ
jgi:hypothetical protein